MGASYNFIQRPGLLRLLFFAAWLSAANLWRGGDVAAQDSTRYSLYLTDLYTVMYPVTNSANAATLRALPAIEYGTLGLGYAHESGNFKPVLTEGISNGVNFSTEKYRFFKRTAVYGNFSADRTWDAFADYFNTENAYRGTPYILLDTVGHDQVERQVYRIEGRVAHSIGNHTIGASVRYKAGLSAQNRDPRAKIMVSEFTVGPGYMWQIGHQKLGITAGWDYRSEEVEVKVIEDFQEYTLYYLLGIRAATSLSSNSFVRRYNRQGYRVEGQWANAWLTCIMGGNASEEGVTDGMYSLTDNKDFARMQNTALYANLFATFREHENLHSIVLKSQINEGKGTEIVQKKIVQPPYNQDVWVPIGENQSYVQNEGQANLNYRYTRLKTRYLRDFSVEANVALNSFSATYRLLDDHVKYTNLGLGGGIVKNLPLGNGLLTAQANVRFVKNVDKQLNITDFSEDANVTLPPHYATLENVVVRPDYAFFTSGFWESGIRFTYALPLQGNGTQMYLSSGYMGRWATGERKHKRQHFSCSVGITL